MLVLRNVPHHLIWVILCLQRGFLLVSLHDVVDVELMLLKIGPCMVEVELMTFGVGLWQALLQFQAAFGLHTCMVNISAAIGLCRSVENRLAKIGLPSMRLLHILTKLGLSMQCLEINMHKLGLSMWRMMAVLETLGLCMHIMMVYTDTLGLSIWRVEPLLRGNFMILVKAAFVRILNMVWGEVDWEMECLNLALTMCGANQLVV